MHNSRLGHNTIRHPGTAQGDRIPPAP